MGTRLRARGFWVQGFRGLEVSGFRGLELRVEGLGLGSIGGLAGLVRLRGSMKTPNGEIAHGSPQLIAIEHTLNPKP